tara:strand:- start:128 stop:829 length:702 start_codon:yes stop_codon:yes gene_type:complete
MNILNSPNFSKKTRKKQSIKLIVIHYTGMQSMIESLKRLSSKRAKVSCHYHISKKGTITKMVDENKVAWHAGKSKWRNYKNLNKISIGIELENKGHRYGYEEYPNLQIKKLITLCVHLKRKYNIKNSNIVGHSDIAPLRKLDPGEKFPWKKLKNKKIGIWYNKIDKNYNLDISKKRQIFFNNLFKIGYRYFNKKAKSKKDYYVIKAFQRRFLPNNVSGKIDQKTLKISHFLNK